jgi:hypothetical protein
MKPVATLRWCASLASCASLTSCAWCIGLGLSMVSAAALSGACDGEVNQYVFNEPILVHGAQFFPGELPGAAAPPPDASPVAASGPVVTSIQALNTTVYSGEGGKQLSGRATDDASAVGIRLGDLGSGYWVLPLGNPDPQFPGELTFSALVDFNASDPAGIEPLRVVAITASGVAGTQSDQNLCLASRLPSAPGSTFSNDLTACNPALNPAEAVFSLVWDADVDLDLHVITPAGVDVNPKSPLVDPVDAGASPSKLDPRIDRDSIALCVPDGWREEDLAFATRPASGSVFQIHANLFSACSKPSVTFTLTVYEATGTPNVDRHLVQTLQRSGRLTSFDADGDSAGLFVVSYPF